MSTYYSTSQTSRDVDHLHTLDDIHKFLLDCEARLDILEKEAPPSPKPYYQAHSRQEHSQVPFQYNGSQGPFRQQHRQGPATSTCFHQGTYHRPQAAGGIVFSNCTCYGCGYYGHRIAHCPHKQGEDLVM